MLVGEWTTWRRQTPRAWTRTRSRKRWHTYSPSCCRTRSTRSTSRPTPLPRRRWARRARSNISAPSQTVSICSWLDNRLPLLKYLCKIVQPITWCLVWATLSWYTVCIILATSEYCFLLKLLKFKAWWKLCDKPNQFQQYWWYCTKFWCLIRLFEPCSSAIRLDWTYFSLLRDERRRNKTKANPLICVGPKMSPLLMKGALEIVFKVLAFV